MIQKGTVLYQSDGEMLVQGGDDVFIVKNDLSKEASFSEQEQRIRGAWNAQHNMGESFDISDGWVRDVFEDRAIAEKDGMLFSYPYAELEGVVTFGQPTQVEIQYKPVAKAELQRYIPISKRDDEKQIVYGVVMEPDVVDTQKDATSAEEIEKACHTFMLESQKLDLQHERVLEKGEAAIVENYIAPQDLTFTMGETNTLVRKGSWVMATKIFSEDMWEAVKKGDITGFSIKGFGIRTQVKGGDHA